MQWRLTRFITSQKQDAEPKNLPKNEAPPNRELPPESSWITAEQIYKELSQRRTSLAIALGVGSLVAVHELSKVFLDSRYSLRAFPTVSAVLILFSILMRSFLRNLRSGKAT
jgi:hypothetical protein